MAEWVKALNFLPRGCRFESRPWEILFSKIYKRDETFRRSMVVNYPYIPDRWIEKKNFEMSTSFVFAGR